MTDWEGIVRTHGPMAFDTAWRLLGNVADAEEVVQDSLLDAFRLHSKRGVANWGGLLRHLATLRAIDRLRTRRIVQPLACEPASAETDQPVAAAMERELADGLRRAIAELPDREANVFSLRYFGEMTNGEIAASLGISAESVGVSLHRARTKLKETLGVDGMNRRSTR